MKYPETVKTETTYYMLIVFRPNENRGEMIETVYTTSGRAEKKAEEILKTEKSKKTEIAIRKETVFYRDAENELSTNGLFKTIKKEGKTA